MLLRHWRGPLSALILLGAAGSASAQFKNFVSIDLVNWRLAGHVDDYTHNHGEDHRLFSPILGRQRDLYVYTPPGYDPRRAYPVVLLLHMAFVDEHVFVGTPPLFQLDRAIRRGAIPPMIVACPDGFYRGENLTDAVHSLYVNGRGGRFADHLAYEVLPFLQTHYAVRPEPKAHAIFGLSGGGLGGLSLAMKRPDLFGVAATLSSPVNIRYDDIRPKGSRENFSPATYRWKQEYDPEEVFGVFYFGLRKTRARRYIEPVFGGGPDVRDRLIAINPADLLFTSGLRPGQLDIYCHYAGRDNWNFDAHALSFAWLAASQGFHVTLENAPLKKHSLHYFNMHQIDAYRWLGRTLLPPTGPWVVAPAGR